VRNITDAGHLEGDGGDTRGDQNIKKQKLAHLEPMEICTEISVGFHDVLQIF